MNKKLDLLVANPVLHLTSTPGINLNNYYYYCFYFLLCLPLLVLFATIRHELPGVLFLITGHRAANCCCCLQRNLFILDPKAPWNPCRNLKGSLCGTLMHVFCERRCTMPCWADSSNIIGNLVWRSSSEFLLGAQGEQAQQC